MLISLTCVTTTMDFFGRAQQHKGIQTKKEKTNMVRHIHRHVSMLLLQLTRHSSQGQARRQQSG